MPSPSIATELERKIGQLTMENDFLNLQPTGYQTLRRRGGRCGFQPYVPWQKNTGVISQVRVYVLDYLTNVVQYKLDGTPFTVLSGSGVDDHLAVLQGGTVEYGLVDAIDSTIALLIKLVE